MHSNRYTLIYATILSIITAVVLAVTAEGLKPAQEANVALDKKSNILKAVRFKSDKRDAIEHEYAGRIQELVIDASGREKTGIPAVSINLKNEIAKKPEERQLPLYVYTAEGGKKYYIIPVQGVGLWGPIWGYVSLENDFNTIYGTFFDHKSETPGLGAEIAELPFQQQFQGKKIMSDDNRFISVNVVKKSEKNVVGTDHRVDAISGGTITSRGTDAMLKNCMAPYMTYFQNLKSNKV